MSLKFFIIFVCMLLIITIVNAEDDLLDEYVKYVENNVHFTKSKHRQSEITGSNSHSHAGHAGNIVKRRHKRDLHNRLGNTEYHLGDNNVIDDNDNSEMIWTHHEILDVKRNVQVHWFRKDREIVFRIEADTTGYVGLGFSPTGSMKNADIVLAWFDDEMGRPVLWDCHGSPDLNTAPIRDEIENYNLLRGEQIDQKTIIEFSRLLDTCDDNDYILGSDTVRLIWAIHDEDPQLGAPLKYHGIMNRGTRSVHLLTPTPVQPPKPRDPHVRKWEVTLNNFVVPGDMDTLYWCKIFKPPTLQEIHHIIGYEPIVGMNHTEHAHHMLLYECELGRNPNINEWESYVKSAGAACYGPFMPRAWEVCLTPVVAWAVGSKGDFLPGHVGLPIAEKPNTYYMLEIHFDNPNMKRSVGTSGLKIHYTRRLRRHHAGVLVSGVTVSPLHVIPPKQPEYKSAGLCSSDCTSAMFPERGINVVSVLLHSHLAGKRLSLRHIRNGEELPRIIEDNNYDFDYQQTRMLKKERVVFPGDTLVTECVYQTKKRTRPTVGGYSTKQEMCLAFVLHYPRTQLAGCYSMAPIKQFFNIFGVHEFYNNDMKRVEEIFLGTSTDSLIVTPKPIQHKPFSFPSIPPGQEMSYEANQKQSQALQQAKWYTIEGDTSAMDGPLGQLIIKEPEEFQNKTFMSHLSEIQWSEPLLTKQFEESFYFGQHLTFCRKRDDTLALPATVQNFPKFIVYEDNSTRRQCPSAMFHNNSATINCMSNSNQIFMFSFVLMVHCIINLYFKNIYSRRNYMLLTK